MSKDKQTVAAQGAEQEKNAPAVGGKLVKLQTLEEQISFFDEQYRTIKHLRRVQDNIKDLQEQIDQIREKQGEKPSFESEEVYLTVTKKTGYSSEAHLMKVRNVDLIVQVLEFSLQRMQEKRQELENLILS
jgi:ABC-type uncharacterized transport system fused permease/ATPase subunit